MHLQKDAEAGHLGQSKRSESVQRTYKLRMLLRQKNREQASSAEVSAKAPFLACSTLRFGWSRDDASYPSWMAHACRSGELSRGWYLAPKFSGPAQPAGSLGELNNNSAGHACLFPALHSTDCRWITYHITQISSNPSLPRRSTTRQEHANRPTATTSRKTKP